MAPKRDIPSAQERMRRARERDRQQDFLQLVILRVAYLLGRGKRRGGAGGEGVPVDPRRPNRLSGARRRRLSLGIKPKRPSVVQRLPSNRRAARRGDARSHAGGMASTGGAGRPTGGRSPA